MYYAAIAYLRSLPEEEWLAEEGRGVALSEAVLADIGVIGPRSTTVLSSLDLDSIDARARRVRTLASFGIDVSADIQVLIAEVSKPRPNRIALNPTLRLKATTLIGAPNYRLPMELDNALAIRALYQAGITATAPQPQSYFVEDALLYLLESRRTDGSWNLVRGMVAGDTPPAKRIFVTAEVLRALLPYRNHAFSAPMAAAAQSVGINTSVALAIDAATGFLMGATYGNAIDRAASLRALVEAAIRDSLEITDPYLSSATAELVALGQSSAGTFGNSPLAASLAAQALKEGSQLPDLFFDRDGDGLSDGPDPDSDDDGVCDPGETHTSCSGSDAFPVDDTEHLDTDRDGIGDNGDPDRDGDGICDTGQSGMGCTGQDQYLGNSREHADFDVDGIADVADADDDGDGVTDVEEKLAGLDSTDVDTDGDSFRDGSELAAGTNGADAGDFPLPDGDIFPLGAPDGVLDLRDALLSLRISTGAVIVSSSQEIIFYRHADVAPRPGHTPSPDGAFGVSDAMIVLKSALVTSEVSQ